MRIGLLQLNSGEDRDANLATTVALLRQAVAGGAGFVATPECTDLMTANPEVRQRSTTTQERDPTLAALRDEAARAGIWLLIGSIAVLPEGGDGRYANRSLLIAPDGGIAARYDKIHMFDVDVTATEVYRESASFRPGEQAVLAETPLGTLGLTVCYDLRFPQLFRRLALGGATVLSTPAAFNHVTGAAHWEVLQRARAIENGAWVIAPAQTGHHPDARGGPGRRTHGHSMVVAPWGEVVLDAGTEPGAYLAEIDPAAVTAARARVPSIRHDRPYDGP